MFTTESSISHEIDRVKVLIEQCLMHYMNKEEVIHVLHQQQNILPSFTNIVWEHLEKQNPEFFKAYYLSIILKEQMIRFNHLLEKQFAMMNQLYTNVVALPPSSDASNIQQSVQPVPAEIPSIEMICEMNDDIPIYNECVYL